VTEENESLNEPAPGIVGGPEFTETGDFIGLNRVTVPVERGPRSTPLDADEPEGTVPPAPLWAMKDRRHHMGQAAVGDPIRLREALGAEDGTVYFIDDGPDHCMVGRRVGKDSDGLVYCLVGRIKREDYGAIANSIEPLHEVFSHAHDIELCGVFEDQGFSEVNPIEHYRNAGDIPDEYLPERPFIEFTDPPEIP
jgi:hypothetical protein